MKEPMIPGAKLGRFEIRSKIGAGGMGAVYLVHDTKLDRQVASKILPLNSPRTTIGCGASYRSQSSGSAQSSKHRPRLQKEQADFCHQHNVLG
jgi:serine/threonine protein kinase